MDDTDFDHKAREIQREYLDFLDDEVNIRFVKLVILFHYFSIMSGVFQEGEDLYHSKVKSMIDDKRIRITVNVNDLRSKNPKRTIE